MACNVPSNSGLSTSLVRLGRDFRGVVGGVTNCLDFVNRGPGFVVFCCVCFVLVSDLEVLGFVVVGVSVSVVWVVFSVSVCVAVFTVSVCVPCDVV